MAISGTSTSTMSPEERERRRAALDQAGGSTIGAASPGASSGTARAPAAAAPSGGSGGRIGAANQLFNQNRNAGHRMAARQDMWAQAAESLAKPPGIRQTGGVTSIPGEAPKTTGTVVHRANNPPRESHVVGTQPGSARDLRRRHQEGIELTEPWTGSATYFQRPGESGNVARPPPDVPGPEVTKDVDPPIIGSTYEVTEGGPAPDPLTWDKYLPNRTRGQKTLDDALMGRSGYKRPEGAFAEHGKTMQGAPLTRGDNPIAAGSPGGPGIRGGENFTPNPVDAPENTLSVEKEVGPVARGVEMAGGQVDGSPMDPVRVQAGRLASRGADPSSIGAQQAQPPPQAAPQPQGPPGPPPMAPGTPMNQQPYIGPRSDEENKARQLERYQEVFGYFR